MVNILVPTDFSDLSKIALDFAVKVSNKLDGNITLVHVISIHQSSRASMRLRLESLEEELISCAKEDMQGLIASVSGDIESSTKIQTKIVQGSSFNIAIKNEAKKLRSGLVVMGTRGANGLRKLVLGSNTTAVIESSRIPVLVVPELATFKSFKKLVYATDLRHIEEEVEALLPYMKIFECDLNIFHVVSSEKALAPAETKIKEAIAKVEYPKIKINIVVSKDVDAAVEKYVTENKTDLLTTFTHDHSFYDRLFDRSLTRKLAFQSKLPLLAFRLTK